MRIKRDIGKGQLCTGGGGEVLLGILGGGVPPGFFLNPDPISDQNMPFSMFICFRGFLKKAIPDSRP